MERGYHEDVLAVLKQLHNERAGFTAHEEFNQMAHADFRPAHLIHPAAINRRIGFILLLFTAMSLVLVIPPIYIHNNDIRCWVVIVLYLPLSGVEPARTESTDSISTDMGYFRRIDARQSSMIWNGMCKRISLWRGVLWMMLGGIVPFPLPLCIVYTLG